MCDAPHLPYEYVPLYRNDTLNSEPQSLAPGLKSQRPLRLLCLLPGQFDDELRIEIQEGTIEELETPGCFDTSFQALSYVWGTRDNPATIWIGERTLSVTQNLSIAMRHLRHADEPSLLWVDAICIDQSNTSERSRQVALMGDVFRLAKTVVYWVGPEENDSDYAMQLIYDVSEKVQLTETANRFKPIRGSWEDSGWYSPSEPLYHAEREVAALSNFILRPWFERLWVRQEAYLSRHSGLLMCGTRQFPWVRFEIWISCLHVPWDADDDILWDYNGARLRRYAVYNMTRNFPVSLRKLRFALHSIKCQDDRDRIYAVLNMLRPEEQRLDIAADYSRPKMEVFKDAVVRYLQGMKDSSVLAECELCSPQTGPSWVPDWSPTLGIENSRNDWVLCFRASGPIGSHISVQESTLSVAGVILDTIKDSTYASPFLEEFDQRPPSPYESQDPIIRDTIRQSIPPGSSTIPYDGPGSKNLLEAYTRALVWGNTQDTYGPFLDLSLGKLETLTKMIDLIHKGLEHSDVADMLVSPNGSHLGCYIDGSQIPFRTAKGYVGMGSRKVRPGDMVCVVLGCQRPLVLRPQPATEPEEKPRYIVIGQCYLSGFMYGEALLGELPPRYQAAAQLWSKTRKDPIDGTLLFIDVETGAAQLEDPRLSSLGVDLEPYRKHWEAGKDVLVDVPIEVLRGKGVDVRWLDIV